MSTYITSDSHFGHRNIIDYCNRPFRSVEEMDEKLILNWNNVVQPNDTVYHLGDFSLGYKPASDYRNRLNGYIHLIVGNHEKSALREPQLFESINDILETHIDGQRVTLCHYAMRVWNKSHHGAWHLYGHSHGTLPDDLNAMSCDVGVDCWNYTPVSMSQIRDKMKTKNFIPVDHHGEK